MQVALIHRNQNTANAHAEGGASPLVNGMVRIDGQGSLGNQQGGLLSPRNKFFGFVAAMRHTSYDYEYSDIHRSYAAPRHFCPFSPPQTSLIAVRIAHNYRGPDRGAACWAWEPLL